MYMGDIKMFAKNEKKFESLIQLVRIYSEDIWMEFGNEKWKTTNVWRNRTTKSIKNEKVWTRRKL